MRKLKWGLIGCGDISQKRVAPALRNLNTCDLIAVNRAKWEEAQSFAEVFGARRWYRDWRELLQDGEVEAVYIATPVNLHAEQSIVAAEAGKHVLCEKPMAMDSSECEKMISACSSNGVLLGVAYYRHFYPVIHRIKDIIGGGEIGHIIVAQINAFEWFNRKPGEPRAWLLQKKQSGGGPMMDFGCHRIEVLLDILGPVRQVNSMRLNGFFYERDVEDSAGVHLNFENGCLGVLTVTHASLTSQDTLNLFGSEGSIHVSSLNEGTLTVKTKIGDRVEEHPPHANIHQPLIEDFTNAVLENRSPVVGGEIGRNVNVILDQIYGRM